MNTSAIRGWWRKLALQCRPGEPEECRTIWQGSCNLDQVAQQLQHTCLPVDSAEQPVIEQPAAAITQAPSVWALLGEDPVDDTDDADDSTGDALRWLLDTFLWKDLACLKLLQTGETIPLEEEEEQLPHIRLEILIKLTQQKRAKWIQNPDDILPDTCWRLKGLSLIHI